MYYLSKFCRICVQTGVKLLDLDTLDFDEVKLSEKLEVCTKMVVSRESLSTEICVQCVTKLRISYQFHDMCKKSTNTLQGYLEALLCSSNDEKVSLKEFVNSDLSVTVTPIPSNVIDSIDTHIVNVNDDNIHSCYRERKKRITKIQRCSLLKRLLMPTEESKEERIQYPYKRNSCLNNSKGGLKNIIHFTKNYEFGFKLDKNSNYESTPLDKLTAFSNEFFKKDFSEFRNTILYIIENKDNLYDSGDSDEEDLFLKCDEAEEDSKQSIVKFEEVIVEPDIKIKTEFEYEYEDFTYNCEEPDMHIVCKTEKDECDMESEISMTHNCSSIPSTVPTNCNEYMGSFLHTVPSSPSSLLMDSLVGSYHHGHRRTFSQSNVRCRTRDNPYINPLLKDQFLYRCFKCDKCNRYFKSPGYLKAHCSKVH